MEPKLTLGGGVVSPGPPVEGLEGSTTERITAEERSAHLLRSRAAPPAIPRPTTEDAFAHRKFPPMMLEDRPEHCYRSSKSATEGKRKGRNYGQERGRDDVAPLAIELRTEIERPPCVNTHTPRDAESMSMNTRSTKSPRSRPKRRQTFKSASGVFQATPKAATDLIAGSNLLPQIKTGGGSVASTPSSAQGNPVSTFMTELVSHEDGSVKAKASNTIDKSQLTNVSHAINGNVANKERDRLTAENNAMQQKADMMDTVLQRLQNEINEKSSELVACGKVLKQGAKNHRGRNFQRLQEEIDNMDDSMQNLHWKRDVTRHMKARTQRELMVYKAYLANLQDDASVAAAARVNRSFEDLQFRKMEAAGLDATILGLQKELNNTQTANTMTKDLKTAEVEELQAVLLMRAHREKGREVTLSKLAGDLDKAGERLLVEQSKHAAIKSHANGFVLSGAQEKINAFERTLRTLQSNCGVEDIDELVSKFNTMDDRFNDLQSERFELFQKLEVVEEQLSQTVKQLDHIKVFGVQQAQQDTVAQVKEVILDDKFQDLSYAYKDYVHLSDFLSNTTQGISSMCARLKVPLHKDLFYYPCRAKYVNDVTVQSIRDVVNGDSKAGAGLKTALSHALNVCQSKIDRMIAMLRVQHPQQLTKLFNSSSGINSVLLNMTNISQFVSGGDPTLALEADLGDLDETFSPPIDNEDDSGRRVSSLIARSNWNTARYLCAYRLVTKELPTTALDNTIHIKPEFVSEQPNYDEIKKYRTFTADVADELSNNGDDSAMDGEVLDHKTMKHMSGKMVRSYTMKNKMASSIKRLSVSSTAVAGGAADSGNSSPPSKPAEGKIHAGKANLPHSPTDASATRAIRSNTRRRSSLSGGSPKRPPPRKSVARRSSVTKPRPSLGPVVN